MSNATNPPLRTKLHATTEHHEAFYQRMAAVMKEEPFASLPAEELLAIAANFLGKLLAVQDQRKFSPHAAMEIVAQNIEAGNAQMIENLQNTQGKA